MNRLRSPIDHDDRPVSVSVAALVHLHQEVIQARRVVQIRPIWIVQHPHGHLGALLNELNSEALDDVVVLLVIALGRQLKPIVLVLDGLVLVRPELEEGLKRNQR